MAAPVKSRHSATVQMQVLQDPYIGILLYTQLRQQIWGLLPHFLWCLQMAASLMGRQRTAATAEFPLLCISPEMWAE